MPADWPISGEGAPEMPQNAVGESVAEGAEASFEVDAYPTSAVKRWFDIIVATLALGVLAPIWLLALIPSSVIWANSHGSFLVNLGTPATALMIRISPTKYLPAWWYTRASTFP